MTSIITEGNATANADPRFSQSVKSVANVTIAVTDRTKDQDGAWVDGATSFFDVTVWGSLAEAFADTAVKGAHLVVAGELTVQEYTDRDGHTRSRRRITADHAGLSVRFHPARSLRPARDAVSPGE
jgi:single-strand DNA-binding protein